MRFTVSTISGESALWHPVTGGAHNMDVQTVDPENCRRNLRGGPLPLSASNSMNYLAHCLNQPNSWVARNYQLYNIQDPVCHWGWDEKCTLNMAVSNQPSCPHQLGSPTAGCPTPFSTSSTAPASPIPPLNKRPEGESTTPLSYIAHLRKGGMHKPQVRSRR